MPLTAGPVADGLGGHHPPMVPAGRAHGRRRRGPTRHAARTGRPSCSAPVTCAPQPRRPRPEAALR
eukprot:1419170-Alexandrium_andersonii.AAC.1